MDIGEFQKNCRKFAKYPPAATGTYPAMGFLEEVAEFCQKLNTKAKPGGVLANYLSNIANALYGVGPYAKMMRDEPHRVPVNMQEESDWFVSSIKADPDFVTALSKEAGDIQWQLNVLLDDLGISSADVLKQNVDKLNKRAVKGKIGGSGDNREEDVVVPVTDKKA